MVIRGITQSWLHFFKFFDLIQSLIVICMKFLDTKEEL